jgi:hypothetical protein
MLGLRRQWGRATADGALRSRDEGARIGIVRVEIEHVLGAT